MSNATLNTSTSHTPADNERAVIGGNMPSTARIGSLLSAGLANEKKAAALSFTGRQQIALAAMLHHNALALMGERPPTWSAMTDKTGDADTKGAAFIAFRNALYDMVAIPLDKLKKGDVATAKRVEDVAQNRRTHANISNGVKLAVQLIACGVDDEDYVETGKGGAFKVPLSALCKTGYRLEIASRPVPLDGTTYGIVSEGTGAYQTMQANVAQLQRAVESRKPSVKQPEKDTSQADEIAAEGATNTEEGNSTTPTPTPTPGKSGAQPTTAPDLPMGGNFDKMVQEIARIILDNDKRTLIDDFTPATWNALQAIAAHVQDVVEWSMEEADEKAKASAA